MKGKEKKKENKDMKVKSDYQNEKVSCQEFLLKTKSKK